MHASAIVQREREREIEIEIDREIDREVEAKERLRKMKAVE